jgi:AsmA protein
MKTLLKIIAVIVAIFILVLIVGMIAVHFLISPARVKETLIKNVKEKTGRTLTIKHLDFSVFPTLKLQIDNATLSGPRNFPNSKFLSIQHASMGLKILPLLDHSIQATNLTINGVHLDLMVDKHGFNNWSDFDNSKQAAKQLVKPKKQTTKQSKRQTKSSPIATSFSIPQITIANINVSYKNAKTKQSFSLTNSSFKTGAIAQDKAFPFSAKLNLAQAPSTKATITSSGSLLYSLKKNLFELKNTDLNGTCQTKSGKHKLVISNINATAHFGPTQLTIAPISAELYKGKFAGKVNIISEQDQNLLSVNGKVSDVQAQPFLQDVFGYKRFSGTDNESFNITAVMKKGQSLTKQMNGSGSFAVTDVKFTGFNLGYLYQQANNLLQHGKASAPSQSNKVTKFGHLTGSYIIKNGVVSTSNAQLTSPVLQVNVNGSADLNKQKLKLRANVTGMKGSLENLQKNGPTIPFNITGSFEHYKITPDLSGLLGNTLKQEVEKQLKDGSNSIGKALKNLGGLFDH